jgi:hypothetical protein
MALYAFDGTWQDAKKDDDPTTKTNVFRFFDAYHRNAGTNDQYIPGIGTRFDAIGKILGGAFGLGELPRLLKTYDELCKNWVGGDTVIDIVGFSRGAATTLDFCHIIQDRGIRRPGTDDVVEPTPQIRFLGVWDIVAAFGLAFLGNQLNVGHHLDLPKANLKFCFHAMALDERRPSFLNTRLAGACEVWFRGVHSDIGGGNGNQVANDVTLRWMMSKAKAAHLPIKDSDIPKIPAAAVLEPKHSIKDKLLPIRLIGAVDRCHYTVAPLDGFATPPSTCPKESEADELLAPELGAGGLQTESAATRGRVLALWETADAIAKANDFTLEFLREPLLTLFEGRSPLITDDAKLQQARDAVKRLMTVTIAGARDRGFHVLQDFFLTEALFKLPRLFPLTD